MLRPEYPLRTSRLVLRPFRPGDFEELYALQSRPDVARYLYWQPRSRAQTREALARRIEQSTLEREGDVLGVAVELAGTQRLIGELNLEWHSAEHGRGEIGFIFHPDHQGKGYAAEAAVELLRLGFDQLGLHRIIGRCDARNTPSAALMEGLGMRREAHLRENEIVKGEWADEFVYAMLAADWQRRDGHQGKPAR
ncbi:GNAT family N-acetyltransferase [Amycolatopsis nigrescens]|uniref:GNAT family N-acetyltransferase n=1 Tax=Amycolatopsis nigrescens TaxID=381445 RepID=UPI000477538D|nr:GNAT family protein [Amycolatopsis nigrescens]